MSDIGLKANKPGIKCEKCQKDLYHHMDYLDDDCFLACKDVDCRCQDDNYNDYTYLAPAD